MAEQMGFKVTFVAPATVNIRVPFGPNVNDKNTVFAGSIYSALVLAPWSLLDHLVREVYPTAKIAVYEARVKYHRPITADFVVTAGLDKHEDLMKYLRRNDSYKVAVTAFALSLTHESLASFQGKYFILKKPAALGRT
jgi:thioesterase domain-containing protein